jgi:probable HAF family extracellular repeat protein
MKLELLKLFTAAIFFVLLASVGFAQSQQGTQASAYTVIDLGIAGDVSIAVTVANNGLVTGYVVPPPNYDYYRAFIWPGTELGTFGGPSSAFLGGTSGFSETANPDPLGQDFCETGTFLICLTLASPFKSPLPTLGGYNAVAYNNNEHGQAVGVSETAAQDPACLVEGLPQPPFYAVQQILPALWENGQVTALPVLPGDTAGEADGVNNGGAVIGYSGNCLSLGLHAWLWKNGSILNLGTLGGVLGTSPNGINDGDDVTGGSDLPGDQTYHAFLWRKGTMMDIGTLAGDYYSNGNAINNQDQIVGYSCDINFNCRVFLWQNASMVDLNTLIVPGSPLYLQSASSINDRGEIAGYAYNQNTGFTDAFLAVPTSNGSVSKATFPKVTLPANVQKFVRQQTKRAPLRARLAHQQ